MALTPAQQEFILKRVDAVWPKPRKCSVCKKDPAWELSRVFELREFHGGGLVVGGSELIPVVTVSCSICGNMLLFNALKLGVVDQTGAVLGG